MDTLQSNLFTASRHLNDLTGYTSIESLKLTTERLELSLQTTRQRVRAARAAYQSAIAQRSASQREVNDLLQRKHAWSAADLERFTSLYRSDHTNELEEAGAQKRLAEVETEAEEVQQRLGRSMLEGYHEEQIWSDKIRRMSTWGTWGLMAVNVLLFLVFQIGVEPWRRRRLVGGFEEKVREVVEGSRAELVEGREGAKVGSGLRGGTGGKEGEVEMGDVLAAVVAQAAPVIGDDAVAVGPEGRDEVNPGIEDVKESISDHPTRVEALADWTSLEGSKERLRDLVSHRSVSLRMLDVTTIALQSALTGAALVGALAFFIKRSS